MFRVMDLLSRVFGLGWGFDWGVWVEHKGRNGTSLKGLLIVDNSLWVFGA